MKGETFLEIGFNKRKVLNLIVCHLGLLVIFDVVYILWSIRSGYGLLNEILPIAILANIGLATIVGINCMKLKFKGNVLEISEKGILFNTPLHAIANIKWEDITTVKCAPSSQVPLKVYVHNTNDYIKNYHGITKIYALTLKALRGTPFIIEMYPLNISPYELQTKVSSYLLTK
ncbi:hypothetical protein C9J12_30290 [Photobacterium frigidiphilum]|uniref:Uncharacterized protein n=1 Tax=Photobacterium frigidiphilum TaxID=264736 RepID=A0A2T3J5H4_9GAMM|nr:hypothetical protein C9J12_30290 [Photobacterium frigidiphilum]